MSILLPVAILRHIDNLQLEKNKNEVCKTLEKNSIFYEMLGKTQKDSLVLNKDFDIKLDELKKLNSSWFKNYFKEN